MIKIVGEELRQYDLGRQVELIPRGGATMKSVTFERGGVSLVTAIKEQDGKTVADIPNILLKAFGCLVVRYEGFDENGYEVEEKINVTVHKREKPADYEYVETETLGLGNGGGASSWNDLTDKPFDCVPEKVFFTFDGNTEGKETAEVMGMTFVKLSDEILTLDYLAGKTARLSNGSDVAADEIAAQGEGWFITTGGMLCTSILSISFYGETVTVPSTGTWVPLDEPYITKIYVPELLTKIDRQFLPPPVVVVRRTDATNSGLDWHKGTYVTDVPFAQNRAAFDVCPIVVLRWGRNSYICPNVSTGLGDGGANITCNFGGTIADWGNDVYSSMMMYITENKGVLFAGTLK